MLMTPRVLNVGSGGAASRRSMLMNIFIFELCPLTSKRQRDDALRSLLFVGGKLIGNWYLAQGQI